MNKDILICKICNEEFKHLGSHIAKAHKITAKQYKMKFGLNIKEPLITKTIRIKKQIAFNKNRKKYLANILGDKSKKYQFKKGEVYRHYFSKQSIDKAIENLDKINTQEEKNCPFCNLKTRHLESHIYNAHGYLKLKK